MRRHTPGLAFRDRPGQEVEAGTSIVVLILLTLSNGNSVVLLTVRKVTTVVQQDYLICYLTLATLLAGKISSNSIALRLNGKIIYQRISQILICKVMQKSSSISSSSTNN